MEGQINQERHYDFSDDNYDRSDEEWGNDDEESCKDYIEHMASIGKVCDENDYKDFCARVRGEGNYYDTMRHECEFESRKRDFDEICQQPKFSWSLQEDRSDLCFSEQFIAFYQNKDDLFEKCLDEAFEAIKAQHPETVWDKEELALRMTGYGENKHGFYHNGRYNQIYDRSNSSFDWVVKTGAKFFEYEQLYGSMANFGCYSMLLADEDIENYVNYFDTFVELYPQYISRRDDFYKYLIKIVEFIRGQFKLCTMSRIQDHSSNSALIQDLSEFFAARKKSARFVLQ